MMSTEKTYQDPPVNLETEHYWSAAKECKLMLKRCNDCGEVHHYPRAICPRCLSSATEWVQASGRGRIYSFSVMRRAQVPYAIAYVTLDEGVTMMSNIVECDFDQLAISQPVEVAFRFTTGGESIPVFRPLANTGKA